MENEALEIEEVLYGIYIEHDTEKRIVKIFSDLFEQPNEESILLGKGTGDKFAHAHLFLEKPIFDGMSYNYKYEDGHVVERTDEEKQSDIVITEPEPTPLEKAEARIASLEAELQTTNVYITDVEIASMETEAKAQKLEAELLVTNQYMTDLELLVLENITIQNI